MTSWDFVIVGAGSAGCVMAARLSEDPACRVLLLEAGGSDRNPLFRVPLMTGTLLRNRWANWFYSTEPEPNLAGRRIFWPRGKVLGGSSSINGMVYTRGLPLDYDTWAQGQGMRDWRFERVLPYFRRSERNERGANEFHGGDGPLKTSRPPLDNKLFDAFVAGGREAGFPVTDDFNGAATEGFGRYDFTLAAGERWSSARAFLDPARARPNLTVVTRAHALRVLFEGTHAVGVRAAVRGRTRDFRAASEVILCGGTVNSPQLLMLSGVGDAGALAPLGIPVVADLKGVGKNLQDHLLARVEHECLQPITLHNLARADRALAALIEALVWKRGPAAAFPLAAGAFVKSHPGLEAPDLQAHFLPGLSTASIRLPGLKGAARRFDGHAFFANIYQLRPESRGEIALRSADPRAAPAIRPNYLSHPRDREVLREGIKLLRRVFAQNSFDPFRGRELAPGPGVASDAEIEAWLATAADTVFHPVGSCKMGTDTLAVVDGELRVHAVERLRVVDASIMPTMPSANTNAPTIMIAEKAADYVRGRA